MSQHRHIREWKIDDETNERKKAAAAIDSAFHFDQCALASLQLIKMKLYNYDKPRKWRSV